LLPTSREEKEAAGRWPPPATSFHRSRLPSEFENSLNKGLYKCHEKLKSGPGFKKAGPTKNRE